MLLLFYTNTNRLKNNGFFLKNFIQYSLKYSNLKKSSDYHITLLMDINEQFFLFFLFYITMSLFSLLSTISK